MILALKRSCKNLTTLKLRSISELLTSPQIDESKVTLQFPFLQHLDLNTSKTRQDMRQPAEISSWVRSSQSLETFSITQQPMAVDEPEIINLLGKVHFVSLAEIHVKVSENVIGPPSKFRRSAFRYFECHKYNTPCYGGRIMGVVQERFPQPQSQRSYCQKSVIATTKEIMGLIRLDGATE